MNRYFAGIDLGGTNIAAGIVDCKGNIIGRGNLPARAQRQAEEICRDMQQALAEAVKQAGISYDQIKEVGIGVPGAVYGEDREIGICNNFRLDGYPVKRVMEEMLEKQVFLENDANAAVLGECMAGAGKDRKNLLMLTLGTGIGSGIMIDGKIFSGAHGLGGEIGHMGIVRNGIPCTCGRRGCFESYASASGLIHICRERMEQYKDSSLWKAIEEGRQLNGKLIFEAAEEQDPAAGDAIARYIEYLSYGIASCIYIFDPECILIGGGISNQGDVFVKSVRRAVGKEMGTETGIPDIVCAQLGNDAGIIGAAYLGKVTV